MTQPDLKQGIVLWAQGATRPEQREAAMLVDRLAQGPEVWRDVPRGR